MLLQGPNDVKTSNYYCSSYLDLEHLGNPSSQLAYKQRDEQATACPRRLCSTSSSSERLSDHRKRLPLSLEDGWIDSKGDDETPVLKMKRLLLLLSLKKWRNLESDSAHLARGECSSFPLKLFKCSRRARLGKQVLNEEHSDNNEVGAY